MISPSKRRRSAANMGAEFTLHLTAARRLATHKRLRRAAVGALGLALVGAVVGFFMPVSLLAQLAGLVVGAAVGALLPVRPQTRPALSHIAATTGLAYETALGVQAHRDGPTPGATGTGVRDRVDEYGLEAQLIRRAGRSIRDYRPEPTPPWWLPVATLALTVVALSRMVPGLSESTRPPPVAATTDTAEAVAEPLEFGDDLTPALPAAGRADAPSTAVAPAGGTETRDALPPGGSDAGNEALSRFLEALRQSPPDGRSSGEQAGSGGPQGAGDGSLAGDIRSAPSRAEPAPEASEVPPATDQTQQRSEQAPGSRQAGAEGDRANQGTDARQGAEAGQDADSGQDAGGTRADESSQGGGAGAEEPGAEGADEGARLDEGGQVVAGGDTKRPGEEGAGGEAGTEPGGAGDDLAGAAGAGGSEVPDTGAAPEGALAGGVELLPGVIQDGPLTPAGNVRLPGDDQVQLPQGVELGHYATAVEEALGEGDLPADYQEIIRRYFR
ncbi:MAG: hypothetical protein WC972_07010 [Trueperaceae bacterium]|nr:hypothetical protein [Trueperaceae bacterium]